MDYNTWNVGLITIFSQIYQFFRAFTAAIPHAHAGVFYDWDNVAAGLYHERQKTVGLATIVQSLDVA